MKHHFYKELECLGITLQEKPEARVSFWKYLIGIYDVGWDQ